MSRAASIDLNADVGEGSPQEAALIPLVSSVNIACGAHAGDEATMRRSVALALVHEVAIGAHPGFEDRANFGRRELPVSPAEAAYLVISQTERLQEVAARLGAVVGHIKLHGALYNMVARDPALAAAVVAGIGETFRHSEVPMTLVALAGSALVAEARRAGLPVVGEAFADRTYRADGSLTPRADAGALITDPAVATAQVLRIATEGRVVAQDGRSVAVDARTVCLHGDGPGAVEFALRVRRGLAAEGIAVAAPGTSG